MSVTIVDLEKAWLDAEAKADVARREATKASEELARKNGKARDGAEIKILLSSVERAKAEQAAAERRASDAFDKLWQARGKNAAGGTKGGVSAMA